MLRTCTASHTARHDADVCVCVCECVFWRWQSTRLAGKLSAPSLAPPHTPHSAPTEATDALLLSHHNLVQVGGTTVDHGSYLVPRGTADIFFPTDFPLLCMLYRQAAAVHRHTRTEAAGAGAPGGAAAVPVAGMGVADEVPAAAAAAASVPARPSDRETEATAEHMCTADFMALYCPDPGATATRDGYNPLLQDYSNTAFFLGSSCSVDGGLVGSSSSSGTSSSSGESSGGSSSGTNGSSSAGGA